LTGAGEAEAGPARRPVSAGSRVPAPEPLALVVFVLLVLACFAAFFVTQRLKHTPTVVQRFERTPTFTPGAANPERRQERISFKLDRADRVTVSVIDAKGNVVAVLVRDYPAERYKQLSLRWNGREGTARRYAVLTSETGHRSILPQNTGRRAPPGDYRIRVYMHGLQREVLSPWSFTLVAR
jgi:hypothetical protein